MKDKAKDNKPSTYQRVLNHLLFGKASEPASVESNKTDIAPSASSGLPVTAPATPSDLPSPEAVQSDSGGSQVFVSNEHAHVQTTEIELSVSSETSETAIEVNLPETAPVSPYKMVHEALVNDKYPQLQQVLKQEIQQFTECKAIACVDIQNEELLALELTAPLPEPVLPFVAAAVTGIFTEPHLIQIANFFKEHKGRNKNESNFHEMFMLGDGTNYLLMRMKNYQNCIVVFAMQASLSYGMTFHQGHVLTPKIEAAVLADLQRI